MGKSTSCFKIITCGGDSDETNDAVRRVAEPESKRSNDKKGWSFRKKSDRHRPLSNTVTQEVTPGPKESPESAGFNFQQLDVSIAPEKTPTIEYSEEKPQLLTPEEYVEGEFECVATKEKSQSLTPVECTEEKSQLPMPIEYTEEKPQLSIQEVSKVLEPVPTTTNEVEDDVELDESVVIIIQTAIRGFLAHKELGKLKKLVKLQAAVRGHLVRRHAVGTLRCIQAIVKMQVLVRARLSQEGSTVEKKLDGMLGSSAIKQKETYTSIEKLLSNRFARQLMDSTLKTKPIRIKCDPSKPNSAWSWLERWMSVSSSEKASMAELPTEQSEREKSDNCGSPDTATVPSEAISDSNEPKSDVTEALVSIEREEKLITSDASDFVSEECQPTSSVMDDLEKPQIDNNPSDLKETSQDINSQDQMMQTDEHCQKEVSCLSKKPEIESEQPSEQLELESNQFVFVSRKVSNPAFIAAKTKFEELSSTANSSRSIDSSHQDVGVDSTLDTVSSGADTMSRSKEPSFRENAVLNNGRVQYGDSECRTELSITSTLDSPDKFEVGTMGYEHGAKVSEQKNCSSNSIEDLDVKEINTSEITVPNSSLAIADQPKKLDDAKDVSANLLVADSPQVGQEPLKGTPDQLKEPDSETGKQTYKSSPEASPRSNMIVPESQGTPSSRSNMIVPEFQGTPSSEVSVKAKKKKKDKSGQKRKSLSASKSSPSTPAHDSGARSSMEQLPKDQKNGKVRNSPRPENMDDEPRDSNNSNSLPRFMHATESARAKANAKNSPRSSPDVQDRDIHIKKRLSLPAANGRQGSPRIQRVVSQAQQGAKGNEKWQR